MNSVSFSGLVTVPEAGLPSFSLPPLDVPPAASLLQQVQHLFVTPFLEARRAVSSGETALLGATQSLLNIPGALGTPDLTPLYTLINHKLHAKHTHHIASEDSMSFPVPYAAFHQRLFLITV